ncbi:hypothetical protein L1887_59634 [Cichorium endivia]|nr:hypothetical protein L1887_59634 [Cichorium endivia]
MSRQLSPAGAGFQARRPLPNLGALAGASMSTSIKQEDASTSYYVREPSDHNGTTSPAPYQSSLLRGDQRAFNDPRDVSHSHSASLSIFSSGSSDLTDYQQEEREAARMQTNGSRIQPPVQVQPIVTRRVSAQRKARTSLDDRPYRPGSDDDDDDDDNIGSPTRRRRKGRNSGSLSAYDQGKIDNLRWRNGTAKGTTKKSRGRNSLNSQSAEHDVNSGSEDGQDDDDDDDDDAGAASGKETRFDGASDEEIDEPVALVAGKPAEATRPQDAQPNQSSLPIRLALGVFRLLTRLVGALLSVLLWLPLVAGRKLWRAVATTSWKDLFARLAFLLTIGVAVLVAYGFGSGAIEGLSLRSPSISPSHPVSIPSDGDFSHRTSLLDRENRRLRADLQRLTNRLDELSSSIESQISSRLQTASAKIVADAEARKDAELSRLTASTKRQVSRLAQDELRSIQESVSNNVETMLRDLDRKIDGQLKRRADDTEGKFFAQLEREVGKIAKYANDEVNAKLAQSFDQTFLSELIEDRLERYSRDRTGRVDWAAVTSGAWVGEQGTVHRGYRYNSVWNLKAYLAQGRKVPIGEPVKAITPGAGLGADNCWMTGWNSMIDVNLAAPKVVDEVVLEHPLPGMARTAPRRVIVWGTVDESDRDYYRQYRRKLAPTAREYFAQVLPEPFLSAVPAEYADEAPLLLAWFEYRADGNTLQTFNLTDEAKSYPYGVEATRWQFIDGWARNPPLCIHRLRVHGEQWPLFAQQSD